MKRQFLFYVCVWAAAVATQGVSRADVVFSNFGPGFAYNTSFGNIVGNAFDSNDYAEGDTFTPAANETLSSLTLALSCFVTCPDAFSISITTDGGDQPGTALESFSVAGTALGPLGTDNAPILVDSTLHPLLTAGTQYWVTVASDLNDSIEWNVNSTGDTADQAISTDGGATWFSPSGQTPGAFEVVGAPVVSSVPEPGTAGLLLSALVLCGLAGGFSSAARGGLRHRLPICDDESTK
jgi:hypothetical protein